VAVGVIGERATDGWRPEVSEHHGRTGTRTHPLRRVRAVESVFGAVGSRTLWVGDVGAATRLKLTTVGFGIALTSVLAEALGLAKGLGVDPAQFAGVITGGPMDSPYLQAKLRAVLDDDYTPSFTVRNAEKDTRLIAEAAADAGVAVDLAVAAGERFRRARAQGHGDQDMIAGYFGSFPEGVGSAG
jgi:3-hydroxyisobutyrate dehydrogenase